MRWGGGDDRLVPDRLAYPELFPAEYRYAEDSQLAGELERRARQWVAGELDLRGDRSDITAPHAAAARLPDYARLFAEACEQSGP